MNQDHPTQDCDVLVVGGSLVGLSAAVFLSANGVKTLLIEPHTGSHPHPRAVGYTPRTQELYDSVGLGAALPDVPRTFRLRRVSAESLAGRWNQETDWTPNKGPAPAQPSLEYSPHSGAAIAQDRLEPALRERARELGAELRLGQELVRFTQGTDGVSAVVRDREGRESHVRSRYMIATDGARSFVRESLGIARSGPGKLQTVKSVLFRAALDEYLQSGVHQFEIEQPGLRAFLTTYGDDRWVLMFLDDKERDDAALRSAITQAIGRADIDIEIIVKGQWELSALITERFSQGRIFIAGDAAHTLPPTRGGYGANTGIADVHNLAWKLAAVLSGKSSPALLDTYDAERRPIAWTRLEQTFARPDYAKHSKAYLGHPILDETAIELGQLYRSAGILGAGPDLPVAARPDEWKGQPGTRAPHVRLSANSSTLDLFGKGWVLITADDRWIGVANALPIDVVRLSPENTEAFGIGDHGASLVRPDGYVAWRAYNVDDAAAALQSAFAQASFAKSA